MGQILPLFFSLSQFCLKVLRVGFGIFFFLFLCLKLVCLVLLVGFLGRGLLVCFGVFVWFCFGEVLCMFLGVVNKKSDFCFMVIQKAF